MLELLMLKKATSSGAIADPDADQKTDTTALITKYGSASRTLAVSAANTPGGGGGIAIYNNQMIVLAGTKLHYYNMSPSFSLVKSLTIANVNITYNNASHQYGKHYFIGNDRSNVAIYHIDLEAGTMNQFPTPPVKKGTFFGYKGKLYLIGGFLTADNTANLTKAYVIDIANPTAWTAVNLKGTLPINWGGASCYFTDSGLFAVVGGGALATSSSASDGSNYNIIALINPETLEVSSKTMTNNLLSQYHNPTYVYKTTIYQFAYAGSPRRWPLTNDGIEATLSGAGAGTISGYHNVYGQCGRVALYTNSYTAADIYITILPL